MRLVDVLFWYAKALFYVVRYPAYSDDYIKQEIESQATQIPQNELARYSEFSKSRRHFLLEISVCYLLISLKNLYFVYYTMTNVDFVNPETNIKQIGDAGGEFGYTCLVSNCPKYIETESNTTISLAYELIELPMFAICKQEWKWLFNPILGSQRIALVLYSDSTFFLFAVCVVAPICICSDIMPLLSNETFLFCICPQAEYNKLQRKISQTLEKLSFSLNNYAMNRAFKQYDRRTERILHASYDPIGNTSLMSGNFLINCSPNKKTIRVEPNSRSIRIEHDERDSSKMLMEYLPINRTQWWRQKWAHSVTSRCIVVVIYFYSSYVMILYSLAYYVRLVSIEEQSEFLDSLERANCSLWFNHRDTIDGAPSQSRESREILNLKHLEGHWNWFTISELILTSVTPIFISYASVSNYYFVWMDIKVCIIELETLLKLAIDYIELDHAKSFKMEHYSKREFLCPEKRQSCSISLSARQMIHKPETRLLIAATRPKSALENETSWLTLILFDRMIKTINVDWAIVLRTPVSRSGKSIKGKLEAQLVNQEFASYLMKLASSENKRTDSSADLLVRLLEKIHVNYRTLVELLAEHNPGFKVVLISSCLGNYGFTLICVYLYRNINDFKQGPLLYLSVQWTVVTFLISIASSIHADLQHLDHVFWSIVACTTNCQDIRVQHFRRIWYKNLIAVNADGGLAVKIGKISVTYVRILQLTFGTATILALALSKY